MRVFSNYYMDVVYRDENVLHLRRSPTWKSVVLFLGLWGITHFVSLQAQYPYLGFICYVLGVWFCYLATEKYEDCIFDKRDGTVTMMSARFLQKMTIGYKKKLVSELSEVIGATVVSVKPTMFAEAHQVVLIYITGLTLSVTAVATYGNKRLHQEVLDEIKDFMGFKLNQNTRSKHKMVEGEADEQFTDKKND